MVDDSQFRDWVQEKSIADGLISVQKPYGIPSTALTEMYKRVSGEKVGHGGTLDPLAHGAMLLGIGKGTKLLTKYLESGKRYRASILIGATSSSGDLELPIEVPTKQFVYSNEKIEAIFQELASGFTQELPALNSSKQHGKTAYALVREGKIAEKRFIETKLLEWKIFEMKSLTSVELRNVLQQKIVELQSAFDTFNTFGDLLGYPARKYGFMLEKWVGSLNKSIETVESVPGHMYLFFDIEVFVPKGTYIRSLAQDIAFRLESVRMLLALKRLNAGNC